MATIPDKYLDLLQQKKAFAILGTVMPDGSPQVLAKLNGEINKALEHPELKAAFAKIGVTPRGTTPEEAAAFTSSEYEKWRKVIVEGKIKPE